MKTKFFAILTMVIFMFLVSGAAYADAGNQIKDNQGAIYSNGAQIGGNANNKSGIIGSGTHKIYNGRGSGPTTNNGGTGVGIGIAGAAAFSNQKQQQGQQQGQQQTVNVYNEKEDDSRLQSTSGTSIKQKDLQPNHIQAPVPGITENRLIDHGDVMKLKTKGSLFARMKEMNIKQAKRASKGAKDIDTEDALVFEPEVQLWNLFIGDSKGEFMGYLYFFPDGPDVTLAQLEAHAAKVAMEKGATGVIVTYDMGKYLEGTTKGIGFGAGASAVADNAGDVIVAPGFGTGWSKSKSNNEMRPGIMLECWFDETRLVEHNPEKSASKDENIWGYINGRPVKRIP